MEVDFFKENVAVADNAAQTEISVFLQNSWDELIMNRNLQGTSSPPWIKSTLYLLLPVMVL